MQVSKATSLQHLNLGVAFVTDESLYAIVDSSTRLKECIRNISLESSRYPFSLSSAPLSPISPLTTSTAPPACPRRTAPRRLPAAAVRCPAATSSPAASPHQATASNRAPAQSSPPVHPLPGTRSPTAATDSDGPAPTSNDRTLRATLLHRRPHRRRHDITSPAAASSPNPTSPQATPLRRFRRRCTITSGILLSDLEMDSKRTSEMLKLLEKQNEVFMDTYNVMFRELHKLQVEEELLMRKLYALMSAEGLLNKGKQQEDPSSAVSDQPPSAT